MKKTDTSFEELARRLQNAHKCSCGDHGHRDHHTAVKTPSVISGVSIAAISCEELSNDGISQQLASDFDHLKL